MARTGRPAKPIEVHRREGTLNATRHAKTPLLVGGRSRPKLRAGAPKLVGVAFRAIVRECEAVLDAADAPMVEAAAVMLVRARIAAADVEKRGMLVAGRFPALVRGDDGLIVVDGEGEYVYEPALVENPSVKQELQAWAQFRQIAELLGIGPSSRARLSALKVVGREPAKSIEGLEGLQLVQGGAA